VARITEHEAAVERQLEDIKAKGEAEKKLIDDRVDAELEAARLEYERVLAELKKE